MWWRGYNIIESLESRLSEMRGSIVGSRGTAPSACLEDTSRGWDRTSAPAARASFATPAISWAVEGAQSRATRSATLSRSSPALLQCLELVLESAELGLSLSDYRLLLIEHSQQFLALARGPPWPCNNHPRRYPGLSERPYTSLVGD
ncbi:hypothetical protein M434DRAFT_139893 [Hypoxylon sp. CO27-5]|nr:hypothetical protein M434DRAFT_139893 [Hypoxylon sp. CO27-5]